MVFKCTNVGCTATFLHSMQLTRHRKGSKNKPPCQFVKAAPEYKQVENGFKCERCQKVFPNQSNASRHVSQKVCEKGKNAHTCTKCELVYQFKSQLDQHMEKHRIKESKTCKQCNKYFAWQKSFDKHHEICMGAEEEDENEQISDDEDEHPMRPTLVPELVGEYMNSIESNFSFQFFHRILTIFQIQPTSQ